MDTLTYRGKSLSPAQLRKIEQNLGYLIWMKLPYEYMVNPNLKDFLDLDSEGEGDLQDQKKEILKIKQEVDELIDALKIRRIERVRLGVSWAEWEISGGPVWIEWYLKKFFDAGFSVVPNLNYTPWRFAEARLKFEKERTLWDREHLEHLERLTPNTNIPPFPLSAFAEFVDRFIEEYGKYVEDVIELWNEPNIDTDWLPMLDPDYKLYVEMFKQASEKVRKRNKKVLLGGPSKTDKGWFQKVGDLGLFDHVDIIGLHGLRGTWSDKTKHPSWNERALEVEEIIKGFTGRVIPIWITEAGFTTVDLELKIPQEELEEIQVAIFADIALSISNSIIERVYWYTLSDLVHESVRFITTGWEDILQFYFGDINVAGSDKLLGMLLKKGGPLEVLRYVEENNLWDKAQTVINRGDPVRWTGEKLKKLLKELDDRAHRSNTSKKLSK